MTTAIMAGSPSVTDRVAIMAMTIPGIAATALITAGMTAFIIRATAIGSMIATGIATAGATGIAAIGKAAATSGAIATGIGIGTMPTGGATGIAIMRVAGAIGRATGTVTANGGAAATARSIGANSGEIAKKHATARPHRPLSIKAGVGEAEIPRDRAGPNERLLVRWATSSIGGRAIGDSLAGVPIWESRGQLSAGSISSEKKGNLSQLHVL